MKSAAADKPHGGLTVSSNLSLKEAVEQLRAHPDRPVRAEVEGGLLLELRVLPRDSSASAADAFAALGPWEGETPEEIHALVAEARKASRQREVPAL